MIFDSVHSAVRVDSITAPCWRAEEHGGYTRRVFLQCITEAKSTVTNCYRIWLQRYFWQEGTPPEIYCHCLALVLGMAICVKPERIAAVSALNLVATCLLFDQITPLWCAPCSSPHFLINPLFTILLASPPLDPTAVFCPASDVASQPFSEEPF